MATIDDLQDTATVKATIQTTHHPEGAVEEVVFRIVIPQDLLNTIAGGDTRSRVMVQDWLQAAMVGALNG
tara:strand:- start:1499 stop:1708 length:210 start_codon:yes stop_codon:yes gene_type:complete